MNEARSPNSTGSDWEHNSQRELFEEIREAILDYSIIFPPPYSLAPNLELASRAIAAFNSLHSERSGTGSG